MNTDRINKILNKGNKRIGMIIIVASLCMIMSSIVAILWNPLFLLEYIVLVPFVGEWGTMLVFLSVIIWASYYYLNIRPEALSIRRMVAFILFAFSIMMLIVSISWTSNSLFPVVGPYVSLTRYYDIMFVTPMDRLADTSQWSQFGTNIWNLGMVLPVVLWLLSLVGFFEPLGIIVWLIVTLYFLYVILMNDWSVYLAKLNPFNKDAGKIHTNKKVESIDLNEATAEFETNFSPEEKEKIEIIEKVRTNMDRKSYEELSLKIKEERDKLKSLREQVLIKVKKQNEELKSQSKISDERRNELVNSLGYTSYSLIKQQAEANRVEHVKMQEAINQTSNYVPEEKVQENLTLINEGYKTTEETLNIDEPMLSDAYVEELVTNSDPTTELPLISDYYNDIFSHEDEFEQEVVKTLETRIDLNHEENLKEITTEEELREVSGEIILEQLVEEVSVEQYLEIPEEIEKTMERVVEFQQTTYVEEENNDEEELNSTFIEETSEEELNSLSKEETEEEEFWEDEEDEEEEDEIKERPLDWCTPYVLPSTSILSQQSSSFNNQLLVDEATDKSKRLNEVFSAFGVKAIVNSFEIGPTVSTFKVQLEAGIKTTKVTNLEDNIKLTLGAEYIRIIAPIPGTSFIGIEVPNSTKRPVPFKTVYDETPDSNEGIIISIGQDVSGKSMSFDLTKAPHLLVAGSTGSGKSVAINTILASILLRYKPTDVQLVLVDPKMVEFAPFHNIPHLLAEVIIDASNANKALQAMVQEMEDRYLEMAKKGAKKIEELNEILIAEGKAKKPYIVVIIDELADLMMVAAKEVEESIMRITQKARAAGIHMVLATQRPSTEIITGTIKSNIPSRMAFTVASSIDSRTILGTVGAEKLVGMGDMLVSLYGKLPVRGQGAYISNGDVEAITSFTRSQCDAHYIVDVEKFGASKEFGGALIDVNDPIYIAAKDTVIHYQKASTSMLQRHLNIGYNKAANIIETLEAEGVIGPAKGSKPREILVSE